MCIRDRHLEEQGASPNPTTVYRYLDKLAGEQRIMKYVADKGEKAVFQYVDEGRHCREHLHLKCVQCGRIYHLDCHFMDEVRSHLMAEHGFTLQCEGSVLYGLCRHCAQKEEQSDSDEMCIRDSLNAASLEAACSMVRGTCRSMGVTVEG